MNRLYSKLIIGTLFFLFNSCIAHKMQRVESAVIVTDSSGLKGKIVEVKGNLMPMRNKPSSMGKPLLTKVFIFKPLLLNQLKGLTGQWCDQVTELPIDTCMSDSLGEYSIQLVPGHYSILIGIDGGYFIPYFDTKNVIAPFEIQKNTRTQLDIVVNKKAVY